MPLLTLAALAEEERDALYRACEAGAPLDAASIHATVMRLMTVGTWQVRALREFLLAEAARADPRFAAATATYQRQIHAAWGGEDLEKVLAPRGCESLRTSLLQHGQAVEAGQTPAQGPFRGSVLARTDRACLPDAKGVDPTKFNFVTVDAEDVEEVSVAAVTPTSFYYEELTAAHAFTFRGRRMLLAVVPKNSYSVIAVRQANLLLPKVVAQVVPGDRAYSPAETATGCVTLDMTLNSGDRVFLDGVQLETRGRRTDQLHLVPIGKHTLTVLRPARQGSRTAKVYDNEVVVTDDVRCERISLDLSEEKQVALLGVVRAGNCAAELTVPGIVSLVREEFRQRGEPLAEMDAQNALLETTLSAARHATPAVATRAIRDWTELLTDLARTHWRRGFDRMLFFELRCDRFGSKVTHNELSVHVVDRSAWSEQEDPTRAVRSHSREIKSIDAIDAAVATLVDTALGKSHARFVRPADGRIQLGAVDYFWSPVPAGPEEADETENDGERDDDDGSGSLRLELFELPGFVKGRRDLRKFCRRAGAKRTRNTPFTLKFPVEKGRAATYHLLAGPTLVAIDEQGPAHPLDRQGGQQRVAVVDRYYQDSLAVLYRGKAEIEDAVCVRSGRMQGGWAWAGIGLLLSANGHNGSDGGADIEAGHVWRLNRLLALGSSLRYGNLNTYHSITNEEIVYVNKAGDIAKVTVHESSGMSLNRKHRMNLSLVLDVAPAWPVAPLIRVAPYIAGNIVPENVQRFAIDLGLDLWAGLVIRGSGKFIMTAAFRVDLPELEKIHRKPSLGPIAYRDDLVVRSIPVDWASRVRLGAVMTIGFNWGEAVKTYEPGEFLARRRRARKR